MIYLDNNATTAVAAEVRDAMLPYLTEFYGNPSSTHRFGQESRQAIEHARHQVAALIGAEPRELIFTSGGTEANNAAIFGLLEGRGPKVPQRIITSTVEHSAVREPLATLKKRGVEVVEIGVDTNGRLDMAALQAALMQGAALASIMWANNETGVVFDIAAIAALCVQHGVPLHVDAVQVVGKLPVNVATLPIAALSLSGHKFHGPKGVGALWVRRGVRWMPWLRGGPQERDRRGGTENVAGIVGIGKAAELALSALGDWDRVAALRDRLEQSLLKIVGDTHVNGDRASRLPNTTNLGFAGLEAEAILLLLSEQDVCASAGAACASGSLEPSHVLRAMGLPDRVAHGAVRFSLSRATTAEEIDRTLAIVPPVIERLRATLPV